MMNRLCLVNQCIPPVVSAMSAEHLHLLAVDTVLWLYKSWLMDGGLSMCRDHILNIKDAPAPKAVGKGAKRTLEQATAAPPAAAPTAPEVQPPQEGSAGAQQPAAPSAEGEQPSDGQEPTEPLAAQEQTLQNATQEQQPGLAEGGGQSAGSDAQADYDAAMSTVGDLSLPLF